MSEEFRECQRCSTWIAYDRNFCDPHYLEALQEYEIEYEEYERYSEYYYSLSDEEKKTLEKQAQIPKHATLWTVIAGLVVGVIIWLEARAGTWYPLADKPDFLWDGAGITLVATVIFICLKGIIGRIIRFLKYAAIGTLALAALTLILSGMIWFCSLFIPGLVSTLNWINSIPKDMLLGLYAIIAFLYSLIAELRHRWSSSAVPAEPSKPRP